MKKKKLLNAKDRKDEKKQKGKPNQRKDKEPKQKPMDKREKYNGRRRIDWRLQLEITSIKEDDSNKDCLSIESNDRGRVGAGKKNMTKAKWEENDRRPTYTTY